MRNDRSLTAITIAAALGALGGIDNPLEEARRYTVVPTPRQAKKSRGAKDFDPAKRRAKRKQAQRSRRANKK